MARIRCFWLEPTDRAARGLRRFTTIRSDSCPRGAYHNALVPIGEVPAVLRADGHLAPPDPVAPDLADPRFPASCDCGRQFAAEDRWQVFDSLLYRRSDTAELVTLMAAPAGAMWDAWWYGDCRGGPFLGGTPEDGTWLIVRTPGGEWCVDSRASNCDLPDDLEHRCWIRHGKPPDVTVDKSGGRTCGAGAGSIACGGYHGFLRAGWLED